MTDHIIEDHDLQYHVTTEDHIEDHSKEQHVTSNQHTMLVRQHQPRNLGP